MAARPVRSRPLPARDRESMADELAPPFDEPSAEELPALVEALLFVADDPVTEAALARALGTTPLKLQAALDELGDALAEGGVRLQRGPEGVQLITAPQAAAAVEHFLGLESGRRLSTAALETLAVVAYRQPVTRAAIEAIRGTSSDAVLATLRARGLIARIGRARGPGRAALYGTTQRFLEHFGLSRSEELPGLDDFAERLGLDPPAIQPSLLESGAAPEAVAPAEPPDEPRSAGPATQAPRLPNPAATTLGGGPALPDGAAARVPGPRPPAI